MAVLMFPNGHILTDEELATVDEKDTETCSVCRRKYFTTVHKADMCFGCYYQKEMDDAAERFRPLSEAFGRQGFFSSVMQTGGMVMVLYVHMPHGSVLIGEPEESDTVWCCSYEPDAPENEDQSAFIVHDVPYPDADAFAAWVKENLELLVSTVSEDGDQYPMFDVRDGVAVLRS